MRNVQKRGFKHCENTELSSVLAYGFREVGEIVVQIVDGCRVIVHGSDLVQLFWARNLCWGRLDQIARLLVLVRSPLDQRFQVGKVRQDRVDRNVSEVVEVVVGSGLEVTVKEQQEQGLVKHEKGEGEMKERYDMRMRPTLETWAMHVCSHA